MTKAYPSFATAARVILVLILTSALAARPAAAEQGAPRSRPNFVILMADDMGYGDASCYGNTRYETPNIDRLAAQGMRFTDFHSSGPVCSPTRAGLLTGRYQQRAGVPGVIFAGFDQNRHHGLFPHELTFPEPLEKVGYTSAVFGKWHLGYRQRFNPMHHGFDRFRGYVSGNIDYISHYDRMEVEDWWCGLELVPEDGYCTHLITKHSIEFIEENKDRPFCAYIAHECPHSPYQGPTDPPVRGPDKKPGVGKKEIARAYREMMTEMDKGVGQVVATIDRLGLAEETLVFFFSDNGGTPNGTNGPLRGFKGQVWEGGHRVPAIARWCGRIEPGSTCDEPAITLDIMPTMLDLARAKLPDGHKLDGTSLAPAILQGKSLAQRKLFWDYREHQAMRDGPWKLVTGQKNPKGVHLYNLADDLAEQNDLAEKHPDRAKAMLATIAAWQEEVSTGATQQPVGQGSP